jgi:hypothetical protein
MAHFVERMKEMTVDGELNKKQKTNKDLKIDEPSIDGKVDDAVYIFPQDDDETVEMENIPQTLKESEMNDFRLFSQLVFLSEQYFATSSEHFRHEQFHSLVQQEAL